MSLNKLRLGLMRALVALSFVWPFINANYFFPQAEFEVNFLPVFVAAAIAPEILAADGVALALLTGTLAFAATYGSMDAVLRIAIGAFPCIFLLNLQQYCVRSNKELIPRSLAYRTLQLFVSFSVLQWIDFYVHSVIPGWITDLLTVLVPRYSGHPYDELGLRGVQGWASEPSGAAVISLCFAVVAVRQDPRRRLWVLLWLCILVVVNKSIYGMVLVAVFGFICLARRKYKWHSIIGLGLLTAGFLIYALKSARLEEVVATMVLYGADPAINIDLARVNQMLLPLAAFPGIYKPFTIFGVDMQPMGLLPLLVGYGSVFGLSLYARLVFFKLPLRNLQSSTLALLMLLMISFVVPPDLIPAIVAFTYALTPTTGLPRKDIWHERVANKLHGAYAAP